MRGLRKILFLGMVLFGFTPGCATEDVQVVAAVADYIYHTNVCSVCHHHQWDKGTCDPTGHLVMRCMTPGCAETVRSPKPVVKCPAGPEPKKKKTEEKTLTFDSSHGHKWKPRLPGSDEQTR